MVNSRPLTRVPLRCIEDSPITPNHFLRPCFGDNAREYVEDSTLLTGLEENHRNLKIFLKKRSYEYLPLIAARSKWHKKVEPLYEGDLVFITHADRWVRGRIAEVFVDPETDEVIVSTSQRNYRRSATQVAKIRILQVNTEVTDEREHLCQKGVSSNDCVR